MEPEASDAVSPPRATSRDVDERRRLWQLTLAIWVSCANTSTYGIGGYLSPILKREPYSFSQSDLALVAAVSSIFGGINLPAGFVFDRYGAAATLRVGSVVAFIGNGLQALLFFGYLPLTVASLAIQTIISFQSYAFFETGSFVTNLSMFARDKGTILLVEEGTGSAVLAAWYVGFMHRSTDGLLILAPFMLPVVATVSSFFIEKPAIAEEDIPWHGHRRFLWAYITLATTLAVYATADIVANFMDLGDAVRFALAVFGVVAVLGYALVPLIGNGKGYRDPAENMSVQSVGLLVGQTYPPAAMEVNADRETWEGGQLDPEGCIRPPTTEKESLLGPSVAKVAAPEAVTGQLHSITLKQAIFTPELWLIFAVSAVQWGTSTVIGGNRPQIYQALNNGAVDNRTLALFMSLTSVNYALARCTVALLDRKVRNKSAIMLATSPLFCLASLLLLWVPPEAAVLPFFLSSFADSLTWSARALTLKQLFHGASFGIIYNFMFTLSIACPFAFNLGIFATLYDQEAHRLGTFPACPERSCISRQMYIFAGSTLLGVVASVALYRRVQNRLRVRDRLRAEAVARAMRE